MARETNLKYYGHLPPTPELVLISFLVWKIVFAFSYGVANMLAYHYQKRFILYRLYLYVVQSSNFMIQTN